ncbi:hypothetical protein Anas_02167 [Armadillidium nasatum]|uniref:Ubiquitin-like protease family profile domain-containing protein n=1 Tax=Armadillidium nasatum TaxID=96803 RepID=A0A5N5T1R6_9CRUS|nr:hypothetical protein Anas_02167 [Armadillidium nasatum]
MKGNGVIGMKPKGMKEELNEEDDEEEEAEEEPPLKKIKFEEGEEETDTPIDGADASNSKESKPPPLPSNNNSSTVPEPIKQPCILIFDSLSGASRSRIVATLRDYLTIEHQKKKNKEKVFTKDTMKGACPKVPQQTNFSDCGLFTLQFAESFFGDPIKDFKLPIKTLNKWFDQDVVAGKRKEVATLIKSLMDEHKPNHNITLPQIHFNSKENAPSGSPDSGENEMKAKDLVRSPEGGDSNQNIKYEEYLQESHQQSVMSHCNRKININLIKRNAANAVAVSNESQINEVANASGGFPHKREVIFNIGPTLGNAEITKGNEISNRGCSKMSVNKINNSAVDQQTSEEDKIGKSPRRIEIKDDADLLLVFNTDPNSQDNSQVTEINIQSSDSSPDFSASYKSVEESSKSNMSQMFSGASSEDSSKKIFSSGHQTFTPVRNIIYQNTSTGSSSQGMVTTTGALQSTISCASISHEKAKYSSNAKFSKTNHQGLKRHSISGNCTSTQPYLNEEQLLLPGDPRSLHKERLMYEISNCV